mgnify:CR=1 FL=1
MTGYELLQGVKGLSQSQGFYGRLLCNWREFIGDDDLIIDMLDDLIIQCNINDLLDFVLLMEV